MEVLVKLSLQGGHEWETVCDEADPIVFGLVSALPGAVLDASLPSDGLIQVEKKSGERLFLSRSSLVAVSVQRVPTGKQFANAIPSAVGSLPASRLRLPAPFAVLDPFLEPEGAASLAGLAAGSMQAADGTQEVQLDSLPASIADSFVEAMEAGALALGAAAGADARLDLRLFVVGAPDDAFAIPAHAAGGILLLACWPLGEVMPRVRLELADRPAGGNDPAPGTSRIVELPADRALLLGSLPERGAMDLTWGEEGGKVLVAVAALVRGDSEDDA